MAKPSDIKVTEVRIGYQERLYRMPIKFGGQVGTRSTSLNVAVRARNASGKEAVGFGSMGVGSGRWAFPSPEVSGEQKFAAAQTLARRIAKLLPDLTGGEYLHPLDFGHLMEPIILKMAEQISREMNLLQPLPKLTSLVVASPFDAALHDVFGKAGGINCYEGYGKDYLSHDLAHYLDSDYEGEYLDQYVLVTPKASLPLYHLVGAADPLSEQDISKRVNDGLPETLGEWILADGLTHLKIKLDGADLDWDVERVLGVNRVADEIAEKHGARAWQFSLDFNERCENVDYLLELLARVGEESATAIDRVQYIEQPTARDLKAHPENKMHAATKIKPVVIDESLVDYESLLLAEEMGYSGVALKACKGQSGSLILGAAAQKRKLFLCVQDLTCTGAAFLASASLAAHVPTVAAIEGNGRQYCPAANKGWDEMLPGVFTVKGGRIKTDVFTCVGLCCVPPDYEQEGLEPVD